MRDIQTAIRERQVRVVALQREIATLEAAAALLINGEEGPEGIPEAGDPVATLNKQRGVRREITIGDAAEKIFTEVGDLHIDNLFSRLLKIKGLEDMTKQSLDSALRKDKRGRFDLRGQRIFGLKQDS